MNRIEELTEELLNAIKESDIYKDYLREQYKLQQDPELMERVDRYRTSNFRMQQDASRDHFTLADQVSQELSELRKIPEVNAYLDSELAICRELRKVCRTLIGGVDIIVPEL